MAQAKKKKRSVKSKARGAAAATKAAGKTYGKAWVGGVGSGLTRYPVKKGKGNRRKQAILTTTKLSHKKAIKKGLQKGYITDAGSGGARRAAKAGKAAYKRTK